VDLTVNKTMLQDALRKRGEARLSLNWPPFRPDTWAQSWRLRHMPEDVLMSEIEIITDGGRRRRWSASEKMTARITSADPPFDAKLQQGEGADLKDKP
jgi:hypothetical protein